MPLAVPIFPFLGASAILRRSDIALQAPSRYTQRLSGAPDYTYSARHSGAHQQHHVPSQRPFHQQCLVTSWRHSNDLV